MSFPALSAAGALTLVACAIGAYLVGSIPWAYLIVKWVTGEDITAHGTGNVGAMNVRRTTGSWGWFVVAMFADGFKGLIPVAIVRFALPALGFGGAATTLAMQVTVFAVVIGHNFSIWLAVAKGSFVRTGKGLATGGGAIFAYNPWYFAIVVVVGVGTIAITRYMMAGQVAAAFALPVASLVLRQPDWPFTLLMGAIVYAAHHRRFVGLLQGREPKLYVDDGSGPRG
jgi:acyl phosphate:glycerol-3-phosphate acyltransferase